MPNKEYTIEETTIVFGSDTGGGDDVDWSTENIANGAGRQSAQHDLGDRATARSSRYRFRFYTQLQATPTVGQSVRIYLKTSDGTHADNDDGTGDAAVSAEDKLLNLRLIGVAIVDEAAANIEIVASGIIEDLDQRYIQFVLWNASGASITNDTAETKLELTPMPREIQ